MTSNQEDREILSLELDKARRRIAELEAQAAAGPRELNKSADYLRCLVRSIPDLVWLKDPAGVFLSCNSSFESFFGASEAEIVGKTDYDFVSRELADFFRDHDRKAMLAGKPSINEEWLTFKHGGYHGLFETIKTPMRDSDGNLIGVLGIARDITDRKRTEDALARRMIALTRPLSDSVDITFDNLFNLEDIQRLQDAFANATGVASLITTPEGQPITRPSNFCRLCGEVIRSTESGQVNCFRADAAISRLSTDGPTISTCLSSSLWVAGAGISIEGRTIANWLIGQVRDETQNDTQIRAYARQMGVDEDQAAEAFLEVPAMSRQRFADIAQALFTLANQLSSIAYQNIQQARFISERQKAEAQLIDMKNKAEAASRVKSEFLANMSHEIRTPLNGALSMLQLLERTPLTGEQREFLHAAMSSSKRLTRLLADILDISQIEAGKIKIEETAFVIGQVEDAILELFSQAANEKGIRLEFDLSDSVPANLMGDEARLRQIIFNLVGNAIKFTERGFVRVEITRLPYPTGSTTKILFCVRDSGIGITDGQLKEIFEPFFQGEATYTKRFQGAGLGLSIVRKLVHLMHGELAIDNQPGTGTTFYVVLPFSLPDMIRPGKTVFPPAARQCLSVSGLAILLVEDEPISSMAGKLLLESDGHTVTTAKNGQEAFDLLSDRPFDLIFMDVQMPLMDGVEATRKIRTDSELGLRRFTPIVAMTAYTMIGDKEKFIDAGMDDYIAKPVSREELAAVIERVMARRAQPNGESPGSERPVDPN